MPNYVYLGLTRRKRKTFQRFPWHSRERAITNEQVFLKVSEKSLVVFHLGTSYQGLSGCFGMYIHKRWAGKGGKKVLRETQLVA